ncbi:radical SAM family heme chaperone HemW [soil metagenome]
MSTTDLAPDSPVLADQAGAWAGAYVHIPFCARVCPYCDFAVVEGRDDSADAYLSALESEIARRPPWRPLDAVFFGGGTPSRFGAHRLAGALAALARHYGLAGSAEVTLEANPEDWSAELSDALVGAGFTRVSFGAQSFDPLVLAELGRRHGPADISRAVGIARQSAFGSVSLDLIFGTNGESAAMWRSSVEAAVALEPDHISCYALTVERGTPLGRAVAGGEPGPDPDLQADQYEMAAVLLGAGGLARYEVSNWALPGHVCRYNLAVWAQGEYEAFGNGAHGFRDGVRFRNVRRLDAYLDRVDAGESPRVGAEPMTPWETEVDRLFVGLRRTAGVAHGPGVVALLSSSEGAHLREAGLISYTGGRLRVTNPLLTDEVERAVLVLVPPPGA